MKAKRFAALAMALVTVFSLLVVSAGAVSFTDMTGHWAREDVEYLASQGVVNGTSTTTFSPDRKMTACEALLFCSRCAGVTPADKLKIAASRRTQVEKLLPSSMVSWAADEMAVCLETGVITESELRTMTNSGAISRAISRQELAMYLTRAMQIAQLTEDLNGYSMGFADASSISATYRPYVYLLNTYGIVKGDQANRFLPDGALSRAEMVTMLRRAMDFMDEHGIYAELAEYTDYEWLGGVINTVTTSSGGITLLTLNNELTGARSVSLPANVEIYKDNMLTTTAALRVGQYVRVNLNNRGTPYSVRIGGTLSTYSGEVDELDQDEVTLNISGIYKTLKMDRFTEIQVGKKTGGRELIDSAAGYTQATCRVDERGHLAQLQLGGGVTNAEGILSGVEARAGGGQTLRVSSFDGVTRSYYLPAGADVTVNGAAGSLTSRYVGCYVGLYVSNDSADTLDGAAVDTVTEYIQGSLRTYNVSGRIDTVTITDLDSGKSTTYDVASGAAIRYETKATALKDLKKNSFVTACLSGDEVTMLDVYPASTESEGILESISYGNPTVLTLRMADDTLASFRVDLTALPDIYRDDKISSIDRLCTGDSMIVTVRYNEVSVVEAYSQSASVSGTISRITMEKSGVTIDVLMVSGETVSYQVSETVSVMQDKTAISVYALKPDYKISLVLNGDTVVSIQVDRSSSTANKLTGTVLIPNAKEGTLMIDTGSAQPVTVDVNYASFVAADGSLSDLSWLELDDMVEIYGSYNGARFIATLVVVR